jgi:opacity protein-like surface antigen
LATPDFPTTTSARRCGAITAVSYTHRLGRRANIGVDTGFSYVTGVTASQNVTSTTFDVGAAAGLHFNALGGLQLRARVGFSAQLDNFTPLCCITPTLIGTVQPPSDQLLDMVVGVDAELPALVTVAGRPLALRLRAAAMNPGTATLRQTTALEGGAHSNTYGARLGAGLTFALYKGLAMTASYDFIGAWTHFDGPGGINQSSKVADLSSSQHLVGLGIAYAFHP